MSLDDTMDGIDLLALYLAIESELIFLKPFIHS